MAAYVLFDTETTGNQEQDRIIQVGAMIVHSKDNIEVFDELYRPSYNCAPSQRLPIITNEDSDKLSFFKWGLIPFWSKDPKVGFRNINTRAESIAKKPSFIQAFQKRRCLIPSNGFYEWKKDANKTPFRIFLNNDDLFAMAGIWETWKDAEERETHTFSIITTAATDLVLTPGIGASGSALSGGGSTIAGGLTLSSFQGSQTAGARGNAFSSQSLGIGAAAAGNGINGYGAGDGSYRGNAYSTSGIADADKHGFGMGASATGQSGDGAILLYY